MTADCINCVVKWCAKSGKYSFGDICEDFVPITTHADRIRTMSDEELAEFLMNRDLDAVEKVSKVCGFTYKVDREQCIVDLIGWLKQEA